MTIRLVWVQVAAFICMVDMFQDWVRIVPRTMIYFVGRPALLFAMNSTQIRAREFKEQVCWCVLYAFSL